MKKSKKIWTLLIILVLLGLGGGGYYFYTLKKAPEKKAQDPNALPDRIYRVRRDAMILGVTLTGSVNAKRKHKLAMEAPFATKLIKVVDENTHVKKGQVVAEYETYDLNLRIEDLRVLLDNRKKDLEIAEEELEILKSSNEADIRTATDSVISAEDAYNKYWRLEGPRDKDNQRMNVSDAQTAMEEAEDAMKEAQTNFRNTTYSTAEEEEKALTTVNSAVQKYENAVTNYNSKLLERKIFRRYTHPNQLTHIRNGNDNLFSAGIHTDFNFGISPAAVRVTINHDSIHRSNQFHHRKIGLMASQIPVIVSDLGFDLMHLFFLLKQT